MKVSLTECMPVGHKIIEVEHGGEKKYGQDDRFAESPRKT
jgi:hypothetical protein